jgi:hypothetical protein
MLAWKMKLLVRAVFLSCRLTIISDLANFPTLTHFGVKFSERVEWNEPKQKLLHAMELHISAKAKSYTYIKITNM